MTLERIDRDLSVLPLRTRGRGPECRRGQLVRLHRVFPEDGRRHETVQRRVDLASELRGHPDVRGRHPDVGLRPGHSLRVVVSGPAQDQGRDEDRERGGQNDADAGQTAPPARRCGKQPHCGQGSNGFHPLGPSVPRGQKARCFHRFRAQRWASRPIAGQGSRCDACREVVQRHMGVKFTAAVLIASLAAAMGGAAQADPVNVIYGNDRANVIYATPGPDLIYAKSGSDSIRDVGDGDVVFASSGNDVVTLLPGPRSPASGSTSTWATTGSPGGRRTASSTGAAATTSSRWPAAGTRSSARAAGTTTRIRRSASEPTAARSAWATTTTG